MAGNIQDYDMPTVVSMRARAVDPQQSLYEKYQFESVGLLNEEDAKKRGKLREKRANKGLSFEEQTLLDALNEKDLADVQETPKKLKKKKPSAQQSEDEQDDLSPSPATVAPKRNLFGGNNDPKQQQVVPIIPDAIVRLTRDVEHVAKSGLSYMYQFVGLLATRLGDHNVAGYYKRENPVVSGAKSLEEFVRMNAHLGREFLEQTIMLTADTSLLRKQNVAEEIGADIVPPSVAPSADDDFLASILNKNMWAPGSVPTLQSDWAWSVIDESVFSFILNETTLGAIGLALNMLRRIDRHRSCTLKQVIMSTSVVDTFALMCSFQFLLSSGGSAYAGTAIADRGKIKGARLMLSTGIKTRVMLSQQVEGAQLWFQMHVYAVKNPRVKQMQELIDALQQKIDQDDAFNGGHQELSNVDPNNIPIPENRNNVFDYITHGRNQGMSYYKGYRNRVFFVPYVKNASLEELKKVKSTGKIALNTLTDAEKSRVDDYIKLAIMKKQQSQIVPSILEYVK